MKVQAPAQTIYDCIAVDVYACDKKVEHISRFMKLPPEADCPTQPYRIPEFFIINFMLPLTEPSIGGLFSKDVANGPTACFHLIFRLSDWAKKNQENKSIDLVRKFVDNCESEMRERLKIIVQVQNPQELGLGTIEQGLCNKYNALPFLYRAYNSNYHRGPNWFQADFDGHRSGYTTRKARYSLLSYAPMIVANVGFLIESETDAEMPERILGCATVHRLCVVDARRFVQPIQTPAIPSTKMSSPEPLTLASSSNVSGSGKSGSGSGLLSRISPSPSLNGLDVAASELLAGARSFVSNTLSEIRSRVSSLSLYHSADEGEDDDFDFDGEDEGSHHQT